MTKIDGGGPAVCSRCGLLALLRQGHQWLCAKHYRFGQMRATAKRRGKSVPTHNQIEDIIPPAMQCPDCLRIMNWLAREDQTLVATLQHYRDGTLGIVCRSCNTRHAYAPGDSFRDAPKNHKYCPHCSQFLPDSCFYADNSRSGPRKIRSWCKACCSPKSANNAEGDILKQAMAAVDEAERKEAEEPFTQ